MSNCFHFRKISIYFPIQLDNEHIHITVQHPVEMKVCVGWANNLVSFEDEASNFVSLFQMELRMSIWGLCNRKRRNCQKKSNLHLYAKYDF